MFQLHILADHRNYNLLLIAAELGDLFVVNFMLDGGFRTEAHDTNAQTLAYNHGHFEIVSSLLQSNLTYPKNINIQECPNFIIEFYEVSQNLYNAMMSKDSSQVLEILSLNPEIRHFYNLNNESAPAFALRNKLLDMYGILISKDIRFGPHEKFSEIKDKMKESEREELREIHYKESKFLPDNHMHVLLANSRLAPNTTHHKDKYKYIQKAFEVLNDHPMVQILLMIVAASRNFRIVFDFNRDSVEVIDPTADASTRGIFYLSGRIYIAAKQLLKPNTEFEAWGTLAHELCHYAMNLVYDNMAKPYFSSDLETAVEFEEISKICMENHESEEIISLVYQCYPLNMQHAELIVRVPHLIIQYINDPSRFEEVRRIFDQLFAIYEKKFFEEMKEALPEIEARAEFETQKNQKRIRNLTLSVIVLGLLAIIGVISGIMITRTILFKPEYSFLSLSEVDKDNVKHAPILYKNTSLELQNLFPGNSTVYEILISDHISQMLERKVLNFDDPHLHYLDELVTHNWKNLTVKLKEKFLSSNFIFQNESLKFDNLHNISSEAFSFLSSYQIINVLDGEKLLVSKMISNNTKFYAERSIWDENIHEIYYDFMEHIQGEQLAWCGALIESKINTTFDTFYREFVNQTVPFQLARINAIRQDTYFKDCTKSSFKIHIKIEMQGHSPNYEVIDTLSSYKSLQFKHNHVIKIANERHFFILSAEAGTGKTITFEQFTMTLKKQYPNKWVSYVDLKEYKGLYQNISTLESIMELLEKIFQLDFTNEFEKRVFESLFNSGNVILVWNGFDEISPKYSEHVLRILGLIKTETKNIQLVCTRPLYSEKLRERFQEKTYTFIPFDENEQEDFVNRFLTVHKPGDEKNPKYLQKTQKVINATKSREGFETPLLLVMIVELISNDVEIYESENLYDIYLKFVENKVEFWRQKSAFSQRFLGDSITKYRNFDFMALYQSYAIKSELQSDRYAYFMSPKLKVMRQEVPELLTSDEISRMGILFINGPRHFQFVHRTFAEFFVAQFIIENIYNANDQPSDDEIELRLRVFHSSHFGIKTFVNSFLETKIGNISKPFNKHILKVLKTKFQKLFFYRTRGLPENHIRFLQNFFKKELEVLKILLQIDENQTYYTSFFSYGFIPYLDIDRLSIKSIFKPYITNDEYDRFINGRYQKGVILFSMYCLENKLDSAFNISHDTYNLDNELLHDPDTFHVFKSIASNLTSDELKELLKLELTVTYIWSPNLSYVDFFDEVWSLIQKTMIESDQKETLENIFKGLLFAKDHNILQTCLNKMAFVFSNDEIYNIFVKYNVFSYTSQNYHIFVTSFYFIIKHITLEQLKILLSENEACDTFNMPSTICYPFNILLDSLLAGGKSKANSVAGLYEFYFNTTEIQDILLSSLTDFLPLFAINDEDRDYELLFEYLRKYFTKNETSLSKFMLQNIEPTNMNVFELSNHFEHPGNIFKLLSGFFNSTSTSLR